MASLKAKKVNSNLLKKGFSLSNGDHNYFEFVHENKVIAITHTSHNDQDIDDYLISKMRKQCKMEKDFFVEFVKCTKSKEDYIKVLKANKHI